MMPRLNYPPVQCLPPLLQDLVLEIDHNTPAPVELTMSVGISKMAAVAQGGNDISPREGMVLPCSTITMVIAESGTGKTVAESKSGAGISRFDALRSQLYATELTVYHSKLDAHQALRKRLLKAIKASSGRAKDEELQRELLELDKKAPIPPVHVKTQYSDATLAGLIDGMSQWSNTYFTSDEAAFLVDHRLGDAISLINSCHSGTSISKGTGRGITYIADPRLTVLWQMQPTVFEKMRANLGVRLDSEGFSGRALLCIALPKPQPFQFPPFPTWEKTELFNDRCFELLSATVGSDGRPVKKKLLKFDRDAQMVFDCEVTRIQSFRQVGGYLQFFPELAAKIPENIAKIAGIFHAFEVREGDISADTIQRAITTVAWFVDEQVRVFSNPPAPPQESQDALKLMVWLANYVRTHGNLLLPRSDLLHNGPREVRMAVRLSAALKFLWQRAYLSETVLSGDSKKLYVMLRAECFTPEWVIFWCGPNPGFPA